MQRFKTSLPFVKQHGGFLGVLLLFGSSLLLWIFPQRGLNAVFYPNAEWKGIPSIAQRVTHVTLDPIGQQAAFPKRQFSAAWSGWLRIDDAGEYAFATQSDDGSSLFIDHEKVVENGGFHARRKVEAKRFLTRGMHSIKILYLQGGGAYELEVAWRPPAQPETALPLDRLYARPFPFKGLGWLTRQRRVFASICGLLLVVIVVKRGLKKRSDSVTALLKEYAVNGAISLMTVLTCLLLLEGGLRIVFWLRGDAQTLRDLPANAPQASDASTVYRGLGDIIQPSPQHGIVYELKPHLRGTFLGASLQTNSHGLRDVEYPVRKPDNTFRIVGLGDSSMFGWRVEMPETSLHLLEQRLNQPSSATRFEVINFAVPGYNTAIEVEVFLKKCLKYAPDLVILHFNTNDYDLPNFMKRPTSYASLRKSFLFDVIYGRYQQLQGIRPKNELAPTVLGPLEETEHLDESPAIPAEYRSMVGKRGFVAAMNTLISATKARQIQLLVFVIKPTADVDTFRGRQFALISQLQQEHGFWLVNTYPDYVKYLQMHPERSNQDFWVSPTDTHPSVLAHEIEAQALHEFLMTHADRRSVFR